MLNLERLTREDMGIEIELYRQSITEREVTTAFNLGLRTAVYVLEKAEQLSTEGRRHLVESLKKQIAQSEGESPTTTLRRIK